MGKPGAQWRVLARGPANEAIECEARGTFDELVVDDWLHIEQLDERTWWFRIGDARVVCSVTERGGLRVDVQRGVYGEIRGTTTADRTDG